MTPALITDGVNPVNRYRLPGIQREGIAQLSLLETALWPLHGRKPDGSTFNTTFAFSTDGARHPAHVSVYAPLGLQSIDEYVLWGLLGLSLSRKPADATLLATPYWIIKQLGMTIGGFQYDQLRASLERLALVAYQNTAFYNPLSQEHERVTLHFFSSFLPTKNRGAEVATDRAWRIEWSPLFFQMCQATAGTLLFDLDLYRELSPAARRLFLKLKDRFWRTKRVFLNVDDLTINGLGFSANRPLFKRKFDLVHCIRELLDHEIIELGDGQIDPKDLLQKRGKGVYVVSFYEGEYFRIPLSKRATRQKNAIADDPLYEPLRKIGVDEAGIRRLFEDFARGQIKRWISVTDTAMHEKPQGFPGFKTSPAAFLIDGIQHNRLPPDWVYTHEKRKRQQQWERDHAAATAAEQERRSEYEQERAAALQEFLRSPEGRSHADRAFAVLLELHKRTDPHRAHEAAREAAAAYVESENFRFPEFGVWELARREQGISSPA